MKYELWKKTEILTYGDPADKSEREEYKTEMHLVKEKDLQDYADFQANEYGYQDYSFSVDFTRYGTLTLSDLKDLHRKISKIIEYQEQEEIAENEDDYNDTN